MTLCAMNAGNPKLLKVHRRTKPDKQTITKQTKP